MMDSHTTDFGTEHSSRAVTEPQDRQWSVFDKQQLKRDFAAKMKVIFENRCGYNHNRDQFKAAAAAIKDLVGMRDSFEAAGMTDEWNEFCDHVQENLCESGERYEPDYEPAVTLMPIDIKAEEDTKPSDTEPDQNTDAASHRGPAPAR